MPPDQKQTNRLIWAAAVLGGFVCLAWLAWAWFQSPQVNFLPPHLHADWVVCSTSHDAARHRELELRTLFRRDLELDHVPARATLSLRAFQRCTLSINGIKVAIPADEARSWKRSTELEVARFLKAGTNQILVSVFNGMGLPALWLCVQGDGWRMGTDPQWQASFGGRTWKPAARASQLIQAREPPPPGERPWPCVVARFPTLLCFLALAVLAMLGGGWLWRKCPAGETTARRIGAGLFAAVCLLWISLFWNNLNLLPRHVGFDIEGHLAYIEFIQDHGTLPLANDGWEMYQPPLYYLVARVVLGGFGEGLSTDRGLLLVRMVNLVAALAQVALAGLCLRLLFPGRLNRQVFGLLLAAFLPAQLYAAQFVGNEILAALCVTAAIYVSLRILRQPAPSWKPYAALGVCLGAALLSKSSTLIVLPVCFCTLAIHLHGQDFLRTRAGLAPLGLCLGVCFLVCGWHYLRVWERFHRFLITNMDGGLGYLWWTDEGFRTLGYYLRFGRCFVEPYFSRAFLDGIYASLWGDGLCGGVAFVHQGPPWNYDLMAAGYLLAVVPSGILLAGAARCVLKMIRQPAPEHLLLLGIGLSGAFVLLYNSIRDPGWAALRASYALQSIVPLCAAGAVGWDWLSQRAKGVRFGLATCLILGAINCYASFWIRPDDLQPSLARGLGFVRSGEPDKALEIFNRTMLRYPENSEAKVLAGWQACLAGRTNDAIRSLSEAVLIDPACVNGHYVLGLILDYQGRTTEAIEHYRATIRLQSDYAMAFNNLARIRAVHPDPAFRNGPQAVELADQACELRRYQNAASLGTLAAALAEARQFDQAAETAAQAIDLAQRLHEFDFVKDTEPLLRLYQSGHAVREPPGTK